MTNSFMTNRLILHIYQIKSSKNTGSKIFLLAIILACCYHYDFWMKTIIFAFWTFISPIISSMIVNIFGMIFCILSVYFVSTCYCSSKSGLSKKHPRTVLQNLTIEKEYQVASRIYLKTSIVIITCLLIFCWLSTITWINNSFIFYYIYPFVISIFLAAMISQKPRGNDIPLNIGYFLITMHALKWAISNLSTDNLLE